MSMELEVLIRAARTAAVEEGAQQVEVYAASSHSLSVYLDDSRIKSTESKVDAGTAVRVIKGGKVGQSASSCSSVEDAKACAVRAVATSALLPKDKIFKQFPSPQKGRRAPAVWDEEAAALDPKRVAWLLKETVEVANEGGKTKVPNGVMRVGAVTTRLVNSNGLDVAHRNTLVHVHMTAMTTAKDPGEGVAVFDSPSLKAFDPSAIGVELRQKALASHTAEAFKGKTVMTVLIPPDELGEMIEGSIGFAISAENVNRHRSPWSDKVGEEVASPALAISDEPFDRRGMLSTAYDDEGVPTAEKAIIVDGMLKGFVNDIYNALKAGSEPTGNGMRRTPWEPVGTYIMPVAVRPVNLTISPGRKSIEQIVASIDHGLLVDHFAAPEVHPVTGAFGLEIRCGQVIKKGEVCGSINHALLIGNMFETIRRVEAVCNDVRAVRGCILPTIAFGGMELVGSS
jgi:PmbA protein